MRHAALEHAVRSQLLISPRRGEPRQLPQATEDISASRPYSLFIDTMDTSRITLLSRASRDIVQMPDFQPDAKSLAKRRVFSCRILHPTLLP